MSRGVRAGAPALALGALAAALAGCGGGAPARKLIQFGWGGPDTAFMRERIADMEQTPFDGCVYHAVYRGGEGGGELSWDFWGRRRIRDGDLRRARADLQATRFRRFRHNFLRINVTPGDVDWFDDFSPVLENARVAARLARSGRSAGLLLDTETYREPLFDYSSRPLASEKSWHEYAERARARGRELISAMEQELPRLRLFLTFGYSLPWYMLERDGGELRDGRYGLLAPFVDGLVDGARDARIVEGYELSYGYREAERFEEAYRTLASRLLPIVADPERYRRVTSFGFGIWMDYDWRRNGWFPTQVGRNYFAPRRFEASVRAALERSDEYVWIYSETPRWWSEQSGRVALPVVYEEALWRARADAGLD